MTTVTLNATLAGSKPLTVADVEEGQWFRRGDCLYVRCESEQQDNYRQGMEFQVGKYGVLTWCVTNSSLWWCDLDSSIDEILPPNVTVSWERGSDASE